MTLRSFQFLTVSFFAIVANTEAQSLSPVKWYFKVSSVRDHKATVTITAEINRGWHLYSQFIKEGGPIPTRFFFETGNEIRIFGNAAEDGNAAQFYDSTFDMSITWYTERVTFSQLVIVNEAVASINGRIVYMVCNGYACLPLNETFRVMVPQR